MVHLRSSIVTSECCFTKKLSKEVFFRQLFLYCINAAVKLCIRE